ncbi:AroM family protein [Raoultibacter massiliensis]|uniref:AroM family protein n=1 Tax=Raoultibacter massiliensis TaxID=1852371 RepID=A0ABV1JEM8_9ACTN
MPSAKSTGAPSAEFPAPTQNRGCDIIGFVTIGQAPRTDVTADLAPLLGSDVAIVEAGALDKLDDVSLVAPRDGEAVLASRMRDESGVVVSQAKVMPLVQQAIDRVVSRGARAVVLLCTANLSYPFACDVPLIHPNDVLADAVKRAVGEEGGAGAKKAAKAGTGTMQTIAVVVPDEAQIPEIGNHWERLLGRKPDLYAASPYGPAKPRIDAARAIGQTDAAMIVLDCIGYSMDMAHEIERASGKSVVLPRAVLANAAKELL